MHAHVLDYQLSEKQEKSVHALLETQFGIQCQHSCNKAEDLIATQACNLVFIQDQTMLDEYLRCKDKSPMDTSACIVVPSQLVATENKLRKLLTQMEHLTSVSKGLPRLYAIYYDRPYEPGDKVKLAAIKSHVKRQRQKGKYCVMYPFKVNNQRTISMLDSGADDCYITERKARALGLDLIKNEHPQVMSVPGGLETTSNMQVHVELSIKDWKEKFHINVIRDLPGDVDMLLGMRFLTHKRVQAKWDFYSHEFYFGVRDSLGTSPHVLTHEDELYRATSSTQAQAEAEPVLLSACQLRRVMRKGQRLFICHIREQAKDSETTDLFGRVNIRIEEMNLETPGEHTIPRDKLIGKLLEYEDVFPPDLPSGEPPQRGIANRRLLVLEDGVTPIKRKQFRLSEPEREELERQVTYLLKQGWIRPSGSPWGAPVLFAPKADGSLRLCTDYRALNKGTVKNRFPLPNIEDLIDNLHGAKVFSGIDLAAGYHQIALREEDREKTAFFGHDGLYEYCVILSVCLTHHQSLWMR